MPLTHVCYHVSDACCKLRRMVSVINKLGTIELCCRQCSIAPPAHCRQRRSSRWIHINFRLCGRSALPWWIFANFTNSACIWHQRLGKRIGISQRYLIFKKWIPRLQCGVNCLILVSVVSVCPSVWETTLLRHCRNPRAVLCLYTRDTIRYDTIR